MQTNQTNQTNTTNAASLPSVSAIADVLALWGHDGWLTPPLLPVVGAQVPAAGRALTLTLAADTDGPGLTGIYDVLSADLTGRVLVLAGATAVPGAVWGGILAQAAVQQGATAVLVDGFVRDRPEMAALGLPVYAVGESVAGPNGKAHLANVGAAVSVHGVEVAANDMIVIDVTGCVRVPAALIDAVLQAAVRYEAAEDLVARALSEGESIAHAYRHKKSIVDELRG